MVTTNNDDLKKQFEEMDQKVTRLRAMMPVQFNGDDAADLKALAALDDAEFAKMEMISQELTDTIRDMEQLLCGGLLPPRGNE